MKKFNDEKIVNLNKIFGGQSLEENGDYTYEKYATESWDPNGCNCLDIKVTD